MLKIRLTSLSLPILGFVTAFLISGFAMTADKKARFSDHAPVLAASFDRLNTAAA
jgi:hypothetical protein